MALRLASGSLTPSAFQKALFGISANDFHAHVLGEHGHHLITLIRAAAEPLSTNTQVS